MKEVLKRAAIYFTVFLILMGIGGLLVVVSGIVPIKASSGHWAITEWMLHFSSRRSVSTHTLGMQVPSLDQPGFVLRGAASYDLNCRACHGSPSLQNPRVAAAMVPNPPYLPPLLAERKDAELFYVIKHGIKFTGMPAWPSQQRDDEVWAMVAFLRAFPRLDVAAYERLVSGESVPSRATAPLPDLLGSPTIPRAVLVNCRRCHGENGLGRGDSAFPRLAGQNPDYMVLSLRAYAGGQRHSGVMEPIAAALTAEEMRELSAYYARLPKPPRSPLPEDGDAAIQRGREIAERGIPAQRVPSCMDCHGPGTPSRNPKYPDHGGQDAGYLVNQLELFQKKQRGGTAYAHLMEGVAANLNAQQMRDVASYYAGR
jgi:cytochrome c553